MSEQGLTVWLTGLSGAGKTTIASRLAGELQGRDRRVEVLDGDVIRENLSKGLGFSKADRDTNIRRIGFVAELLTRNGVVVIVAAISPYRAVRDEVRRSVGRFLEVYVRCPLDELVRRDVKGLYRRALAGEIPQFTGVSDPYEEPAAPEVVVDTGVETVDESLQKVLAAVLAAAPDGHEAFGAAAAPENDHHATHRPLAGNGGNGAVRIGAAPPGAAPG
jgi:adenylyl-sulfate kinase